MAYATQRDLQDFGLPPQALAGLSSRVLNAHLEAASGRINSYLRDQAVLPLKSPYPQEIIEANVILASYSLMIRRGYNPASPSDENFRERYLDMGGRGDGRGWLDLLAKGLVSLALAADSTPEREGRPRVNTSKPRGWVIDPSGDYEVIP